jgi:hypothetical protein
VTARAPLTDQSKEAQTHTMAKATKHSRTKPPRHDPSAGGKRSAMGLEEDPAEAYLPEPGGDALYVGKARNLKRRVTSYTQIAKLPRRLQRMVAETVAMEVVETHTEVEALLLESNLIKRLMPRYNVLLRDDKSFPYILLTGDTRSRRSPSTAAPTPARATTSAPSPRPARSTAPSPRCSAPSCCAPAATRLRQPHPALPAVPDQALLGALRRAHRGARLPRPREPGARVPDRQLQGNPAAAGGEDGGGRGASSTSRPPPSTATASARCRRSRRTRTSTSKASTTPT